MYGPSRFPLKQWRGDYIYLFTVFVNRFFLNGYDLLTGYMCTRVPVHTPNIHYLPKPLSTTSQNLYPLPHKTFIHYRTKPISTTAQSIEHRTNLTANLPTRVFFLLGGAQYLV